MRLGWGWEVFIKINEGNIAGSLFVLAYFIGTRQFDLSIFLIASIRQVLGMMSRCVWYPELRIRGFHHRLQFVLYMSVIRGGLSSPLKKFQDMLQGALSFLCLSL